MAIKQIIYDSKTIPFNFGNTQGDRVRFNIDNIPNVSGSGEIETVNRFAFIELRFLANFSQATYNDLIAWWSWVSQGKFFDITFDSTKTGNEILTGSAAAGQKIIDVDPTDFDNGDILFLRTDDRFTYEVVVVASQDSDSVVAEDNLKFSYTNTSLLRHYDYYPNLAVVNKKDFAALRTGGLDVTNAYRTFPFVAKEENS